MANKMFTSESVGINHLKIHWNFFYSLEMNENRKKYGGRLNIECKTNKANNIQMAIYRI